MLNVDTKLLRTLQQEIESSRVTYESSPSQTQTRQTSISTSRTSTIT